MYLCVFLVFREAAAEDVLRIFDLLKLLLQNLERCVVLGQDQKVAAFTKTTKKYNRAETQKIVNVSTFQSHPFPLQTDTH